MPASKVSINYWEEKILNLPIISLVYLAKGSDLKFVRRSKDCWCFPLPRLKSYQFSSFFPLLKPGKRDEVTYSGLKQTGISFYSDPRNEYQKYILYIISRCLPLRLKLRGQKHNPDQDCQNGYEEELTNCDKG